MDRGVVMPRYKNMCPGERSARREMDVCPWLHGIPTVVCSLRGWTGCRCVELEVMDGDRAGKVVAVSVGVVRG
jgi:hypothetical protein